MEGFVKDDISLSIKAKVQLFLFLRLIRYLILIQLLLSFLILNFFLTTGDDKSYGHMIMFLK